MIEAARRRLDVAQVFLTLQRGPRGKVPRVDGDLRSDFALNRAEQVIDWTPAKSMTLENTDHGNVIKLRCPWGDCKALGGCKPEAGESRALAEGKRSKLSVRLLHTMGSAQVALVFTLLSLAGGPETGTLTLVARLLLRLSGIEP